MAKKEVTYSAQFVVSKEMWECNREEIERKIRAEFPKIEARIPNWDNRCGDNGWVLKCRTPLIDTIMLLYKCTALYDLDNANGIANGTANGTANGDNNKNTGSDTDNNNNNNNNN